MSEQIQEIHHIPLGLDCTLAYQLNKHRLRHFALPFDWMKINNIETLIEILNDSFFNFLHKDKWLIIQQSPNFNYIDDTIVDDVKSLLKLKHITHSVILPHESINDIIILDKVFEKYNRRVDRFNKIIKSNDPKIIYIGADKINDGDKQKIIKCLDNIGCINYKIKFIEYQSYPVIGEYSWHREWIPWNIVL
jgi:hypothetical protein